MSVRESVRAAMRALDATADEFVMVGDRPDKDVASAAGAGARAVRVRTGEKDEAAL